MELCGPCAGVGAGWLRVGRRLVRGLGRHNGVERDWREHVGDYKLPETHHSSRQKKSRDTTRAVVEQLAHRITVVSLRLGAADLQPRQLPLHHDPLNPKRPETPLAKELRRVAEELRRDLHHDL